MTLEKLNKLRISIITLKNLQEKIEDKKRKAESATQKLSGMPSAKGGCNGKENVILSYVDDEKELERICEEMSAAHAEAFTYIMSIEEPAIHLIFYYRFISGYSWNEVATLIGGNTENSVKKTVYRYIERNK